MTERGREELRPYLRDEGPPDDAIVVIRGGPDTVAKLASHARRTHDAYVLDGAPLWGIFVYCALDDVGPASLDGLHGALPHIERFTCRGWASCGVPGSRCCRRSADRTTRSGSTAMIRPG
jgi:hypothetical protein